MAEKILRIRVEAKSEGLATLVKDTNALEKALENAASKQLSSKTIETQLVALKEKLAKANETLAQKVASANDLLNKGVQNQGLAWYNAQRAFNKYGKEAENLVKIIQTLEAELVKLNSIPTRGKLFSQELNSQSRFKPSSDYGILLKDGMTKAGMQALKDKAAFEQSLRDQSLSKFSAFLSEQERRLAASIEQQKAIQVHGINSIEARKVQAAENERRLQLKLQQELQTLKDKVSSGGLTKDAATLEASRILHDYRSAVLRANQALLEQEKAHEKAKESTQNLATRILEIIGIYRVYNFVLNSISNAIKAIPNIGIQLEATKAILEVTEGSADGMIVALDALTREANRAGLQIQTVRESFRTFSASASLAGESSEDIWKMFTNINTVATALHLTTDQTNHVFLALAQIFNKTKVQSEELVKQLGNLLPGAFASFAAANKDLFTNTADLVAKMKAGVVTAHDTVLKFTQFLSDKFTIAFESATKGLNANINRMKNSWTALGEAIYNSTSGGLISATKVLGTLADVIKEDIQGMNILGGTIKTVLIAGIASAISLGVSKLVSGFVAVEAKIIAANGALNLFKASMMSLSFTGVFGAMLTGLGLIASKFYEIREARISALEKVEELSDKLKQSEERAKLKPEDKIKFDVEHADSVKQAQADLNRLLEDQIKLQAIAYEKGERNTTELTRQAKAIASARKLLENAKETARINAEKNINGDPVELLAQEANTKLTIDKDYARASGNIAEADRLEKLQRLSQEKSTLDLRAKILIASNKKLLEDLAKVTDEGKKKELQAEIDANNKSLAENEEYLKKYNYILEHSSDKSLAKASEKAQREAIKANKLNVADIARENRAAVALRENEIAELDGQNQRGLVSFKSYLEKKEALILEEIRINQQRAEEAMASSAKAGDKGNFAKAQDDYKLAEIQGTRKLIDLSNTVADQKDAFLAKLDEEHAKYQQLFGITDAYYAKYIAQNQTFFNQLEQEITAGDKKALQIKNEIQLTTQLAGIKEKLNLLDERASAQSIAFSGRMERINILVENGTMTQLDSYSAISAASEDYLNKLNEIIIARERDLSSIPLEGRRTIFYQQEVNELQRLKNEYLSVQASANALGNFIRTTFRDSFKESFKDIILNTKSADQAFTDFIKNMLGSMAELLADTITHQFMQLIKELLYSLASNSSSAGGGIWGMLFNLFQGAAASSKGNVFSSGNIVPFSKGGIPDVGNKMQYFPLANGGVGSLRENNKYEAILPLHRDASGSLGVKANISPLAQSAGNVYNITVHVQSGKDDKPAATGDKVAEAIVRRIAREEAGKMQRNTSYANKNQKFG